MSEATALPTETQPQPIICCFFHLNEAAVLETPPIIIFTSDQSVWSRVSRLHRRPEPVGRQPRGAAGPDPNLNEGVKRCRDGYSLFLL